VSISLENFKPILKEGKLEARSSRLQYEIKNPVRQIFVPIYMADVLTLCNGNNTVRDIIEKIYKKQRTVRFRETCELILSLNKRGFFENGEDLEVHSAKLVKLGRLQEITESLSPASSVSLVERLNLKLNAGNVFPFLALIFMGVGLYLGLNAIGDFQLAKPFRLGGSYVLGIGFFFGVFSVMMTLKTLVKTVFLLLATNKAFELKLRFTPLFIALTISNESANIIKQTSERTLYFLAVISTHLWSLALISQWFEDPVMTNNVILAGVLLWGYDMNPVGWGELKDWINSLRMTDSRNPWYLLQYQPHKAVSIDSKMGQKYRWIHDSYMILWGLISLMFLIKLTGQNYNHMLYILESDTPQEKLAVIMIFTGLVAGNSFLVYLSLVAIKNRYWDQTKEGLASLTSNLRNQKVPSLDHRRTHEELLKLPVLNWFSEDELHELLKKSRFLSLRKGQVAFEPGRPAEHLMVLLTGRLQMQSVIAESNQRIKKWPLLPVSIFGEEAFLEGAVRSTKAVASELCTMVEIPIAEVVEMIDKTHYEIQLNSFKTAIMLNQYFHSAPVFSELSEDSIHFMMAKGILEEVRTGETIFAQGTASNDFYLLIKGSVKVVINGEWINTIPQGGFFGEIGVIADIPRTATVEAEADCVLFRISADTFWEVLTQRLEMAIFMEAVGEIRMKTDYEHLSKQQSKKIAS
jgi:CRP-like cAMP-binding protein